MLQLLRRDLARAAGLFQSQTLPRVPVSQALVSHVDFLPTLAGLFAAPKEARSDWAGVDYSALVLDPAAESVQDYVAFTFDDFQAGQPNGPYVAPPNHIRSIREERYKLARYFDPDGNEPEQWEMYDLADDPLETVNIANPDFSRSAEQEQELQRLTAKLAEVEVTRLQPLPGTPEAATPEAATPRGDTRGGHASRGDGPGLRGLTGRVAWH